MSFRNRVTLALLVVAALAGCSNKGGYLDTVAPEVELGRGDRNDVAQCMAKAVAAKDCVKDYQVLVVFEDAAAGWTKVICDSRPGGSSGGAGAAVGSAVGPLGFALGLAVDRAGASPAAGRINPKAPEDHALFSSTLRGLPAGGLEATNWVLYQAWAVEERLALLRESFRACAQAAP